MPPNNGIYNDELGCSEFMGIVLPLAGINIVSDNIIAHKSCLVKIVGLHSGWKIQLVYFMACPYRMLQNRTSCNCTLRNPMHG